MAENKKSFIAYVNWHNTFSKLTDEEAGRMIKHLLAYVNDMNPEFLPEDRLLDILFEPIKATLKDDLVKWERYIEKQKANGKKGGRPAKTEDNPEESTETQAFSDETQKTQAFFSKPKKADNVNVYVNDNVNDNVINNTPKPPKGDSIDFNNLLKVINAKTGREFKVISDPVKKKYLARLKEGYTKDDIAAAITNAVKDQFHAENGFKFLTPEFFSRAATIDKHSNITKINGQGLETGPKRKKL